MDRPWLVAIVGPPAVGKMTVGQQLAARTGFGLYHNHMVIDLLTPFFEFGSASFERLATEYRRRFFEEAAHEPLGIVATWGWRFDHPDDQRSVEHLIEPFLEVGGEVSFVELAAPLEVRLERNRTENRLAHKRTDWATDEVLTSSHEEWMHNSSEAFPFPWPEQHLRIDNDGVSAEDAAGRIQRHFGLPDLARGRDG
jgi:shikimate kinase